jgi:hypothetical protein
MPKVVGFTFVRNAVKYDYPIVESIHSLLPLCDEIVVSIGNSEDETLKIIEAIDSPKIRIMHSVWDDALRKGGSVLAVETDKAFDQVGVEADWCIYLQADEVIHEKFYPAIRQAMEEYLKNDQVDGLLFNYLHFYASYDYVGDSRKWYSHEIRVIRNDKSIRSYGDAQGFRKNGRKLRVKPIEASIHHYGWVKHPYQQLQKINNFQKLWNETEPDLQHIPKKDGNLFDYSEIDSLQPFLDSHPSVMRDRVEKKNWIFDFDTHRKKFRLKDRLLYWIEKKSGKRLFEYRNYIIDK